MLTWWRTGYQAIIGILLDLHPKTPIPWFGPSLSAVSFATARVMETWAHGQDIVDALGFGRLATHRLKHVAYIGVKARSFSYLRMVFSLRLKISALNASDLMGACGFGVTNKHYTESGVKLWTSVSWLPNADMSQTPVYMIEGHVAREWLAIAQAFAGPPGSRRQPGQVAIGR